MGDWQDDKKKSIANEFWNNPNILLRNTVTRKNNGVTNQRTKPAPRPMLQKWLRYDLIAPLPISFASRCSRLRCRANPINCSWKSSFDSSIRRFWRTKTAAVIGPHCWWTIVYATANAPLRLTPMMQWIRAQPPDFRASSMTSNATSKCCIMSYVSSSASNSTYRRTVLP